VCSTNCEKRRDDDGTKSSAPRKSSDASGMHVKRNDGGRKPK
jgi:hypothetical protein